MPKLTVKVGAGMTVRVDAQGRTLGANGLPIGGLASVHDVMLATQWSKSEVYKKISNGSLEVKRFGRSVRVPWTVVHKIVGAES